MLSGPHTTKYNKQSLKSFRCLLAGHVWLVIKKLGDLLPKGLWDWYLGKSGRSDDSSNYQNYTTAFTTAYGSRLRYVTDPGPGLMRAPLKEVMGW